VLDAFVERGQFHSMPGSEAGEVEIRYLLSGWWIVHIQRNQVARDESGLLGFLSGAQHSLGFAERSAVGRLGGDAQEARLCEGADGDGGRAFLPGSRPPMVRVPLP
jgi:hypothetical protein